MFQPGAFPQFWLARRVAKRWPGLALSPGPAHPSGGSLKELTMQSSYRSMCEYNLSDGESPGTRRHVFSDVQPVDAVVP